MNRFPTQSFSFCIISLAAFLAITTSALAAPIFDTFGPLDEATFGGQGIPNDEVAISSQFTFGTDEITAAMSATQRFSNPALTNDGAGTYFAGPGSNFGGSGESAIEGALWNFNFYLNLDSTVGNVLADYQIDLYYDFDTGFDTPLGSLGSINITNALLSDPNTATATLSEGSQNLNFGFLASSIPGFITAPAGSFDPDALGEYNFAITISRSGFPIETVAMDVQVIPEPATMATALAAAGAFCLMRRRRTRS